MRIDDLRSDHISNSPGFNLYDICTLGVVSDEEDLQLARPSFSDRIKLVWIDQLASALIHLHTRARMVHRDIKSQNVIVSFHPDVGLYGSPYLSTPARETKESAEMVLTRASRHHPSYFNRVKLCDFGKSLPLIPKERALDQLRKRRSEMPLSATGGARATAEGARAPGAGGAAVAGEEESSTTYASLNKQIEVLQKYPEQYVAQLEENGGSMR